MEAVEASLRRLQTDHIDLYMLHHPDPQTPAEETLSTLDMLVKQGKVRYIAVCNHYAWQMAYMLGVSALHNWAPLVSIQCRYNILDRAIENETAPFCERFNIATMTYGPLLRVVRVRRMDVVDAPQSPGAESETAQIMLIGSPITCVCPLLSIYPDALPIGAPGDSYVVPTVCFQGLASGY